MLSSILLEQSNTSDSYYQQLYWYGLRYSSLRQILLDPQTIEQRIQCYFESLIIENRDQAREFAESFSAKFIELLEKDWKVEEKEKSQLIARCHRAYNACFSCFKGIPFEVMVNIAKFAYGHPALSAINQDFYYAEAVIHQQVFKDIKKRLPRFPSNPLVERAKRHYSHVEPSDPSLSRKLNRFIFRQLLARLFRQTNYAQILNQLAKHHEEFKVFIHSPPSSTMQPVDLSSTAVQNLARWIQFYEDEALLEFWAAMSEIPIIKEKSQMIAQNTEIKTPEHKAAIVSTWMKSHPEILQEFKCIMQKDMPYSLLTPEIGYFSYLTDLIIKNTRQACSIPEEIGCLTHLRLLNLSGNRLQRLPHTIGNLTGLEKLNLKNNELITLPSAMSQLRNLTHLYLAFNQLTHLSDLSWFVKIHTFDIRHNPLDKVPLTRFQLLIARKLYLSPPQILNMPPEDLPLENIRL